MISLLYPNIHPNPRGELRWWKTGGTLILSHPSSTSRWLANNFEHLRNQSEGWENKYGMSTSRKATIFWKVGGAETWIQCYIAEDMMVGRDLFKETTAKCYKQWSAKLELLEICYNGGHLWLNSVLVEERDRIPGVTFWSEDFLGLKKNGWHLSTTLFWGIRMWKLAENKSNACFLLFVAINCRPLHNGATAFLRQV